MTWLGFKSQVPVSLYAAFNRGKTDRGLRLVQALCFGALRAARRHPCSFSRDGANTNQNRHFANSITILTLLQWDNPVISWRKPWAGYAKNLSLKSPVQTLCTVTGYRPCCGSSFHSFPCNLNVFPPCGWQRTSKQEGLVLHLSCLSWFLQGPASCIHLCF